jgi:hypothetical protein
MHGSLEDCDYFVNSVRYSFFPRRVLISPEIEDRINDLRRKGFGPAKVAILIADEIETDEYGETTWDEEFSF